jgi:5-(carboxyamino)imidazole ribonucleotide mutase
MLTRNRGRTNMGAIAMKKKTKKSAVQVGIIMGSDSDLPIMKDAAAMLKEFGVSYEMKVVSAHRTPEMMIEYGRTARARGLKVIIAGAGGAAHLPGMIASVTELPVVGVPVPLKHLDGQDSLLSIVQMPKGVPVATVAIGNATNAGILAAQMIGSSGDPKLLDKIRRYKNSLDKMVKSKKI